MRRILFILLFLITAQNIDAQQLVSEDAVKIAFIFHFISFIQWDHDQPEYDICIPDDRPLRETAQSSLHDKTINGRPLAVVDRYTDCQVLVSDYIPSHLDQTLTIGRLSHGAIMEFRVMDHKMKFAVDLQNLQASKLKMSSQLLKLAILEKGP